VKTLGIHVHRSLPGGSSFVAGTSLGREIAAKPPRSEIQENPGCSDILCFIADETYYG
jgi:hypothetical protein